MIPIQMVGKSLLQANMERQLEITAKASGNTLQDFFDSKGTEIKILKNSSIFTKAFSDMKEGFGNLVKEKGGSEKAREYLHKLYIQSSTKGANPSLSDTSAYGKAHSLAIPISESIIKEGKYLNLYLIDSLSGDLLYSFRKDDDFMTNLVNGQYKESSLARLFKTIISAKDSSGSSVFMDLDPYSPSDDKPSCFIGISITIDGKMQGVLILKISLEEINSRLSKSIFLNSSEKSYIVGSDYFLRSTSDTNSRSFSYKQRIQTPAITEALRGGSGVLVNESGGSTTKVYNAYSSLKIGGIPYALVVEMDMAETTRGLDAFRKKIFFLASIALFIILIIGTFLTSSFSKPIQESVSILSTSIREISSVIDNHDKTAAMQSASVSETTTTLENISNSSKESAEESELVTSRAASAQNFTAAGHTSVSEMIHSIEELKTKVSSIAEQILRLSEKNSQISGIISLVSELANETNMLALNAAVEAARAGENGKGFEVVAVEIRKLADESKKSAVKIQEIIGEIKNATDSTVMVTEEGVKQAEESSRLGSKVLDSFEGINSSVNSVFGSIEKIATNLKQQSHSISEIVFAMNSISKGSQETSMGIAETKVGVDHINSATLKLKNLIEGKR